MLSLREMGLRVSLRSINKRDYLRLKKKNLTRLSDLQPVGDLVVKYTCESQKQFIHLDF